MRDSLQPIRLFTMTIAIACAVAGCESVDRWKVFEADFQETLRTQGETPVRVPGDYKPKRATDDANAADKFALPDLAGDGPLEISVEQAAFLALRHSRDLAVQQFTPVIVGSFEQLERGAYDPELFGSGEFSEERASEVARSTGQRFDVQGRDYDLRAGIRQKLPTGTTVEGTIEQSRSKSNRTPEQQEARLGLTVTQSLLRGFGPAVNLARIRQAELDTLASVYELRGYTEALLAETEVAYWNYSLAREEIAIFERSLAVAKQQLDVVQQRIEVGDRPKSEAAAAKAEVARREQALIEARGEVEATRLRLMRLMNPDPSDTLDRAITATTPPRVEAPQPITDSDDRLALAERLRPDLSEARLRLDHDRLETMVTRNGLLPRLDLFVTLGKTGFADTFPDSFREIDGRTYDVAAGARFSHVLGNRAAEATDLAARATRQQSAAAVANLRQIVRLDVRLAINQVERSRQQIAAAATTRELQEAAVRAEQERFDVGTSTALLVAQAQRDLLQAQITEVEAVVRYRIDVVNLYVAEGSLLDRRGISVARPSFEAMR